MSVCVGGGWEITPSPSLVGAGGDARRCALLVRLRRWQRRWSGGRCRGRSGPAELSKDDRSVYCLALRESLGPQRCPPKEPLEAQLPPRFSLLSRARTARPASAVSAARCGCASRGAVRGVRPHSGTSRSNAAFRVAVFLFAECFSATHRFNLCSPFSFVFLFFFSWNGFVLWLAFSETGIYVSLRPLH